MKKGVIVLLLNLQRIQCSWASTDRKSWAIKVLLTVYAFIKSSLNGRSLLPRKMQQTEHKRAYLNFASIIAFLSLGVRQHFKALVLSTSSLSSHSVDLPSKLLWGEGATLVCIQSTESVIDTSNRLSVEPIWGDLWYPKLWCLHLKQLCQALAWQNILNSEPASKMDLLLCFSSTARRKVLHIPKIRYRRGAFLVPLESDFILTGDTIYAPNCMSHLCKLRQCSSCYSGYWIIEELYLPFFWCCKMNLRLAMVI